MQIIDFRKVTKDLTGILNNMQKQEDVATVRTLNIVATRSRTMLASDVFEDTGISKATAKRRINIIKATRAFPSARLDVSGKRVAYPGARKIKGGVSFVGTGRKRKKVKGRQDGGAGSMPFVIKGRYSGKKLAVYVPREYAKNKTIATRKVTAMYYSSIAHVARSDWQKKVDEFSIKEFRKEYPKQLKKASYRGKI